MSDLATLQTALAEANKELAEQESALAEIIAGVKAQKKDPETSLTVPIFRKMVDTSKAQIEKITGQIANLERTERTKTIVEPLIAKFGTLTVPDASDFRVEFVDIKSARAKLLASADALTSKISALDKLSETIAALNISEETAADLKAVRFVADGPHTYKLEMARTGTRASGGTRASSSGQIFTITAANDANQGLVGMKVGKGQDFENWRALVEKTDAAMFTKLELGRKGEDPEKPGKKSNWSAAVVAERKFGVKYDSATIAAPAESDDE